MGWAAKTGGVGMSRCFFSRSVGKKAERLEFQSSIELERVHRSAAQGTEYGAV